MEAHSNILLGEGQAVRCMAFEIVPDLFNGIEIRRVTRKPFDMESRIVCQNLPDLRPFVNLPTIPKEDYGSSDVTEHCPQEFRYMSSLEVVLLETGVNTHVFTPGRDGEGRQCRYAVMAITVTDNRSLAHWTPGTTSRRNKQESALIQKGEVGAKFYSFF
jgi:hypothetical protein